MGDVLEQDRTIIGPRKMGTRKIFGDVCNLLGEELRSIDTPGVLKARCLFYEGFLRDSDMD
jgi:hypothetical protein